MRGKSETKNLTLLFYDKLMILLYKCCVRIVTILWWKCGKHVVFFWHQIWIWSLFSAILWLVKKSMPKLDDQSRWWKCAVYLPLMRQEIVGNFNHINQVRFSRLATAAPARRRRKANLRLCGRRRGDGERSVGWGRVSALCELDYVPIITVLSSLVPRRIDS